MEALDSGAVRLAGDEVRRDLRLLMMSHLGVEAVRDRGCAKPRRGAPRPRRVEVAHVNRLILHEIAASARAELTLASADRVRDGLPDRCHRPSVVVPSHRLLEPHDVEIAGPPSELDRVLDRVALIGIDRDDEDFFAAYILNNILGAGGFDSRLMEEVRRKRGLTYGVYSYLVSRDLANVYMGSVASSNDKVAQAIDVIRDEWQRMHDQGVTEQELQDSKTYLTGAYPLRFSGNAQIAGILSSMQMEGLPIDYIATRNDKVNAVTMDDINRVAAELLDPDSLRFVVVGQPQGLDAAESDG